MSLERTLGLTGTDHAQITGVEFDSGRHHRAKIGYVLLASEQTVEDDVMSLKPEGVGFHFARLDSPDEINHGTLSALADQLAHCAGTIIPNGSLDVVCYACTSGSIVAGEERVLSELASGAPSAKPTSLITCVMSALRAVDARRIAVGTPYVDEINVQEEACLKAAGFEIVEIKGMGIENDSQMVRVTPSYLKEFALSLDHRDADAVFISCSALRTLDVIGEIEVASGKAAICSNQAMIWHTLRLAGVRDQFQGYGRLLSQH